MKVSPYAKTVVAVLVAALTATASAITDDRVDASEWVAIALAAVGAVGVFLVPNKPAGGA